MKYIYTHPSIMDNGYITNVTLIMTPAIIRLGMHIAASMYDI